ncbi:MAG: S8 family serine peptidase [Xanthomonadaceae bacterium]|nr:S8 family serine peptidase [Xanthomonadaceae bacterium]MDE2249619.1 S8 family serine peptidase [Xanthomonadaceae bacterium]
MLPQRPHFVLISVLSVTLAVGSAAPARAQFRGPPAGPPAGMHIPMGLPHLPPDVARVPDIPQMPDLPAAASIRHIDDLLRGVGEATRQAQIRTLVRAAPGRVTVDPHGEPVLRGEFLAMGLSAGQLDAVQSQGFTATRQTSADAPLGLDLALLRDTRGRSEAEALRLLQQLAPKVTFAYQHIYLPAGGGDAAQGDPPATAPTGGMAHRVGLIDGGVDPADPALAHVRLTPFGCGKANVSRHGTVVAARLVDGDSDTLYAANLWCSDAVGGATSDLVRALAWMAREGVPVINISLVGPDNPVLARAVQAMIARGHVLVSAVGNDGPAAPPLFPAAYPGVIGVSAVDSRDRVLPDSGSGPQVAFCASGVVGHGRDAMRGTSFAAPIVARRAAQLLDAPRPGAAAAVERRLASEARDLGPPGRDPRYGYGLLSP